MILHTIEMISRITIIDDDIDLRNLLKISLGIHGFEVSSFANGDEFLNAIPEIPVADLYIIDINLGGISGYDLCKKIKSMVAMKHTLILLISANPEVQEYAKDACADGYMLKPFSQKDLITKIESL